MATKIAQAGLCKTQCDVRIKTHPTEVLGIFRATVRKPTVVTHVAMGKWTFWSKVGPTFRQLLLCLRHTVNEAGRYICHHIEWNELQRPRHLSRPHMTTTPINRKTSPYMVTAMCRTCLAAYRPTFNSFLANASRLTKQQQLESIRGVQTPAMVHRC